MYVQYFDVFEKQEYFKENHKKNENDKEKSFFFLIWEYHSPHYILAECPLKWDDNKKSKG